MSGVDLLRFATGALRGHLLRTSLCLGGVGVGVASVILLTALGEGARRYVVGEFETLGSDLIIVVRGHTETQGFAPTGGTPYDLTLDDARALARELGRVSLVAPLSMATAEVSWQGRGRDVPVLGTSAEFRRVRDVRMARGRFLPAGDWERGDRVAVLGATLARELFGEANPVGRNLRIDQWRFKVIGVMASRGESVGLNMDDLALVPVTTGMRIFNRTSLFRIFLRSRSHGEVSAVAEDVRQLLIRRHEGQEDITVISQDALLSSFNRILQVLTLALGGIAAVSLAVAAIGVMNVMLVSVSERTSEIGLLLAVGVLRRQVMAAFLTEAAILSALGGTAGLVAGFGLVGLANQVYPALPAATPGWAVAAVMGVSAAVGLGAGALPARRASRMDPVASLAAHRGTA